MGHYYFGLSDEYETIGGTDLPRCGHSIMAIPDGTQHNMCTDLDHGKDRHSLTTPIGPPSNWETASGNGRFAVIMDGTPDNFDYVSHDFNTLFDTVVQ